MGVSMKDRNPPLVAVAGGAGTPLEPPWAAIYSDALDVAAAHETWRVVIDELARMQTLAIVNGGTIERLVRFQVEFTRAARDVASRGTLVPAKRTGVPAVNPFWPVMKQASAAIRILEAELGLSPAHRGRASKVKHEKRSTKAI